MNHKKFGKNDSAVSPVIGVLDSRLLCDRRDTIDETDGGDHRNTCSDNLSIRTRDGEQHAVQY